MAAEDYINIGRIIKPFGFQGEVKVLLDIEFEEGFDFEAFFILENGKYIPYFISEVKQLARPEHIILKIDDIDSKEAAEKLVKKDIYLPKDDLNLEDESLLWQQLIGYRAMDEAIGELGEIENIYEMPMHEVAAVMYQGSEILIPLNEDVIASIDESKKIVYFNLPEGLLDIYT